MSFIKAAEKEFQDAIDQVKENIQRAIDGLPPIPPPDPPDKIWHKYICLKTHAYIRREQSIHNRTPYSFEEGKEYYWSVDPNNLMYVADYPEHFQYVGRVKEKKGGIFEAHPQDNQEE